MGMPNSVEAFCTEVWPVLMDSRAFSRSSWDHVVGAALKGAASLMPSLRAILYKVLLGMPAPKKTQRSLDPTSAETLAINNGVKVVLVEITISFTCFVCGYSSGAQGLERGVEVLLGPGLGGALLLRGVDAQAMGPLPQRGRGNPVRGRGLRQAHVVVPEGVQSQFHVLLGPGFRAASVVGSACVFGVPVALGEQHLVAAGL